MPAFKTFPKVLLKNVDATGVGKDISLGEIKNCSRHQLVISCKPDPTLASQPPTRYGRAA